MGSTMSFRGELDHGGNPICGDTFMAGTICSMAPDHEDGHDSECQVCGGNWLLDSCTCPFCQCCERRVPTPFHHVSHGEDVDYDEYYYCQDCYDKGCEGPNGWGCSLDDAYFEAQDQDPTDDDMAYVMNSLGITNT